MRVHAVFLTVVTFAALVPLCWYLGLDGTGCLVAGAGRSSVNGYYSGYGGVYVQRGHPVTTNLDVFSILDLERTLGSYSIAMMKSMWSLNNHMLGKVVYINTPTNPEEYLYHPPKTQWKAAQEQDSPSPIVYSCFGSLANTASAADGGGDSNIGILLQRPITTLLLGTIFAIAYYLWAYKVDPSAVAYSYDTVVNRGEYWRTVTASFTHFELLHLGFNTMSLYQLGVMLEPIYGSATFLYLNLSLVILTMLICSAIYHLMIYRYGRTEYVSQQAVGFSCVLFAWMVALSVRQRQYCPIFLFPSFCVDTWQLPLPSFLSGALGISAIPVNIGPFALLVFTKLLLPRSSFIGHLSGIVIGYPLAWNLLHWLTLPVMVSCLAVAWACTEKVYVWTYPGYAASNIDLEAVMPPGVLRQYKVVRILSYFFVLAAPVAVYLMGLGQLLPRAVLAFLCWSAAHACRVEALLTSGAVKEACGRLMVVAVWFATGMLLYDACSLVTTLSAWPLLTGNGLTVSYVRLNMYFLSFMAMVEGLYALLLFSLALEARGASGALSRVSCGAEDVVEDMRVLCLPCSACETAVGSSNTTVPFSGTAYRLVPTVQV
jgi:membrane associated rhomboid family serine protease